MAKKFRESFHSSAKAVAKEKVPMKPHSTHSTFETMKVYGVLVEYSGIIVLRLPLAVFEVICAVAVYMQFDGVSAEQKPVSPRTKTQEPREARESKFLICKERPNSVCV